jgi:hypothetical protein
VTRITITVVPEATFRKLRTAKIRNKIIGQVRLSSAKFDHYSVGCARNRLAHRNRASAALCVAYAIPQIHIHVKRLRICGSDKVLELAIGTCTSMVSARDKTRKLSRIEESLSLLSSKMIT